MNKDTKERLESVLQRKDDESIEGIILWLASLKDHEKESVTEWAKLYDRLRPEERAIFMKFGHGVLMQAAEPAGARNRPEQANFERRPVQKIHERKNHHT